MRALTRGGRSYPPHLVTVLATSGDRPRNAKEAERITDLLVDDPDTGFAVAARWIDAGDHERHGSGLVSDLYLAWRGRESVTVDLLTRALTHQPDADGLRMRLIDMEPAVARMARVSAGARTALTRLFDHANPRVAQAARRCLARGDALPQGTGPRTADVLAALPAKRRTVEEIRAALATAEGNDAITLVRMLDSELGAVLVPDLLALVARGGATIGVIRLLGTIGQGTDDHELTAAVARAMQSREEMHRAVAAASWILLGHPPASALAVLHDLLTTGPMPAWYLTESAGSEPPPSRCFPS